MLFDPEVGPSIKGENVAGRWGGRGREIMNATVKQRKTGLGECYLETEKGHLAPEVKTANEIACDYVWDKLYPTFSNLL
jgi:hypothetical protein